MSTLYIIGIVVFFCWFMYNTYVVESMVRGDTEAVTERDKLNVVNRKKMIKEMKDVAGDNYKNVYWLVVGLTGVLSSIVWPVTIGFMVGFNQKKKEK